MTCKKSGLGEASLIPAQVEHLLSYDPSTGKLYWKARGYAAFDKVSAGKEAFTSNIDGYRVGTIFAAKLRAHRVAWVLHYGEWPEGEVDHVNGDRSDNRIKNLRVVTQEENALNRRRQKNNKTGVNGLARTGAGWRARAKRLGVVRQVQGACLGKVLKKHERNLKELGFHENHGS